MSREPDDDDFRKEKSHLSILEAVENLSNLAEMNTNDKIGIIEDHVIVHHVDEEDDEDSLDAIQWLEEKSEHKTESLVEDTFNTVLDYVKNFHNKEFNRFYEDKNQEGLKKIMLLVGQASDKVNNCTNLFKGVHKQGILETKQYKQLNKFYNERIAIEDKDKVSLIDLSRKERELELQKHPVQEDDEATILSKQFVLGVNEVKQDDFYELLSIRRDDGTSYLDTNLYRNLKLACNFGEYVGVDKERDPLEGVLNWFDSSIQSSCENMLKMLKPYLTQFYKEAPKYRDMELVSSINKGIMALMLAGNMKNRSQLAAAKSCRLYYYDFQLYIREALMSFEYHKLKSFPPPSSSLFLNTLMDIIHLLSWGLYFHHLQTNGISTIMDDIFEEGKVSVRKKKTTKTEYKNIWDQLGEQHLLTTRYLMNYPVGPLFKAQIAMQMGSLDSFDSLMDQNIPSEWMNLSIGDKNLSLLRLPIPTNQEIISKVSLDQEFVSLLDAYENSKENKKHLIVNLQDRTIWREFPRCKIIENLQNKGEYLNSLNVVTISKDSDFYHQIGAYEKENKVQNFFKQLIFNINDAQTGFYFPKWIKERLFSGYIEKLIQQIHRFFFTSKANLSQEERRDFIDIFYQFLILKIIEVTGVTSVSLSCKDSLDNGGIANVEFYSFLKLLNQAAFTKEDIEKFYMMIFVMPMVIRNRSIHQNQLQRMLSAMKRMQAMIEKHGANNTKIHFEKHFGPLYELSIFEMTPQEPTIKKMIA